MPASSLSSSSSSSIVRSDLVSPVERNNGGTMVERKINDDDDGNTTTNMVMVDQETTDATTAVSAATAITTNTTIPALQMWFQQQQKHPISIATMVQADYWPPRNQQLQQYYDWSLPTHEIYKIVYNDIPTTTTTTTTSLNESDETKDDTTSDHHRHNNHNHPRRNYHSSVVSTATFIENMCMNDYRNDSCNDGKHQEEKETDQLDRTMEQEEETIDGKDNPQLKLFTPTFCQARSKLDYTYHTHVVKQRQYLQDAIIQRIVFSTKMTSALSISSSSSSTSSLSVSPPKHRPWIVFTAGPMGVGKGYVMTQLQQMQLFNIKDHFITIDPDLIKYEIPEMVGYLQIDRNTAATKVHRESTQISDIIFEYAILHSLSILVDGSLRDVNYYESLFRRIRREYPQYRIGIIHITATRDVILERATSRAIRTGRVIPHDLLQESMDQVPKSVELLSPLSDAVHVIANHPNRPIQLISSTLRRKKSDLPHAFRTGKDGNNNSNNGYNNTSKEDDDDDDIVITTTTSWKDFTESWDLPPTVIPNNTTTGPPLEKLDEQDHSNTDEAMADTTIASTTTNVVSDASTPTSSSYITQPTNGTKKVLHSSISMSQFFDDHTTHVVANAIWQKSYPNFCARCALVTDEQCGICIHNVHVCACSICSDHPTCLERSTTTTK